ncbi:MAG: hypothetical protein ACPGOV_06250 [Magnetovibrionaceae bacterium]
MSAWAQAEVEAGDPSTPRIHTDEATGYVIAVPKDTQLLKRGDNDRVVALRSRRGFVINIQSGPANPGQSLNHMAGKLEAEYLGPQKAWKRKLGERQITLAGLPAYDAVYDGNGVRIRVVIVRGSVHDFVFMFFASPGAYEVLSNDFEWVLASFRPGAADMASTPQGFRPQQPQQQASLPPGGAGDFRRFEDSTLGASLDLPVQWIDERAGPTSVVFSGPSGQETYFTTVTLEARRAAGDGTLAAQSEAFRRQLAAAAPDMRVLRETGREVRGGGILLSATEIVTTYTHLGAETRKWTIIIPRPGQASSGVTSDRPGSSYLIWSYTAPAPLFDKYRSIAERTLRTLALRGDG